MNENNFKLNRYHETKKRPKKFKFYWKSNFSLNWNVAHGNHRAKPLIKLINFE